MNRIKLSKTGKIILFSVLTLLYLGGIVAMFFNFGLGVLLWAAALIPSLIVFLYQRHTEVLDEEEKAEKLKENTSDKQS